jgi:hypothetical protein
MFEVSPQWLSGRSSAPFFRARLAASEGYNCGVIDAAYCQLMARYNRWMKERLHNVVRAFARRGA